MKVMRKLSQSDYFYSLVSSFFIILKDIYQYQEFCFLTSNFVLYG